MSIAPEPNSQKQSRPLRLLALCDTVAVSPGQALTGFGRVCSNLFSRWPEFSAIDIWGIGFNGHGYKELTEKHPNWTLLPGGNRGWNSPEQLLAFLHQLATGNYTHVFMLMDADALSGIKIPTSAPQEPALFSEVLQTLCRRLKITSVLYYPVDAPMQPPFDIIQAVDVAVTFTHYGREETAQAIRFSDGGDWPGATIHVLPHGLDSNFTPVSREDREKYRAKFEVPDGNGGVKPFLDPGDLLILVVDKNEWRKDPLRPLEILKGLRDEGVPAKLVMRMAPMSQVGGIHLERAAAQLGLTLDKEWAHVGPVPEQHMRGLYGAADLVLKTALGEGWGLSMTEALACGTPVMVPNHTSCAEIALEIGNPQAARLLDLESGYVMGHDTRLRHRVDLGATILDIQGQFVAMRAGEVPRVELTPADREWLSWDRVAKEFLCLMGVNQQSKTTESQVS